MKQYQNKEARALATEINNTARQLIKEARALWTEINTDRQEGRIPSAEATARLVEVSELIKILGKQKPVFSEYATSEGV
jgi:hypothetical protein